MPKREFAQAITCFLVSVAHPALLRAINVNQPSGPVDALPTAWRNPPSQLGHSRCWSSLSNWQRVWCCSLNCREHRMPTKLTSKSYGIVIYSSNFIQLYCCLWPWCSSYVQAPPIIATCCIVVLTLSQPLGSCVRLEWFHFAVFSFFLMHFVLYLGLNSSSDFFQRYWFCRICLSPSMFKLLQWFRFAVFSFFLMHFVLYLGLNSSYCSRT